jgi:hypothetical protein
MPASIPDRATHHTRPHSISRWRPSEKTRSFRRCLQAMVADQSDHCLNRDRFLFWLAPGPPSAAQTSLPSFVSTATIQLRNPISRFRIPSRVPSIPRPIATPTPILLCHGPFRATSGQKIPATEVTETQAISHLVIRGPSRRWQKEESLCELCALCGKRSSPRAQPLCLSLQAIAPDRSDRNRDRFLCCMAPVPSIPIPIPTPTPILLRHGPFRKTSSKPPAPLRPLRESSPSGSSDLSLGS